MTDPSAQILSTDTSRHPEPRPEFLGWITQISHEIAELLEGRESSWIAAVSNENEAAMRPAGFSASQVDRMATTPTVAPYLEDGAFFGHYRLGQVNGFAKLEPFHDWSTANVQTKRWERFAIFALKQIRTAIAYLDGLTDAPALAQDGGTAVDSINSAAGYTIEAMRALQIAQSLRFETAVVSAQNRDVAQVRHSKNRIMRAEALEMAERGGIDCKDFLTIEAAADYISGRLVKNASTQEVYKFETVKKWLISAQWKPKHKRF